MFLTPQQAQAEFSPLQYFCISGEVDGPGYTAAGGTGTNFVQLTTFLWTRTLYITTWQYTMEGYSSVLGFNQNLLALGVIGVQTPTYNLANLPNSGYGSAITVVFAVVDGNPSFYPAAAVDPASPALAVQSADVVMEYPNGQCLLLPANQPLTLYGSLSAFSGAGTYDGIFCGLHFSAYEVSP
jgi:hypothetical protein